MVAAANERMTASVTPGKSQRQDHRRTCRGQRVCGDGRCFAKLREEVKRLKPDEPGISIDMSETEMLEALNSIERTLEHTEVWRNVRACCDRVEREAATMLMMCPNAEICCARHVRACCVGTGCPR